MQDEVAVVLHLYYGGWFYTYVMRLRFWLTSQPP
jgi:hypothetical protein